MRAPNAKLILLLFAAGGVLFAIFGLYRPWLESQQPVSDEEQILLDQQLLDTTLDLQSQLNADLQTRQLVVEKERESSEIGLALALRCSQWTEVHLARPTSDSEQSMDWACRRYNHYITTGEQLSAEPTK